MSVIQDFVSKFIASYVNLCRDFGVEQDAMIDGLVGAKDAVKKLGLKEPEGIEEVYTAWDEAVEKTKTETQISLSYEEVKALQNILNHAFDGTIVTSNKAWSKAELDELRANIKSIKGKLK